MRKGATPSPFPSILHHESLVPASRICLALLHPYAAVLKDNRQGLKTEKEAFFFFILFLRVLEVLLLLKSQTLGLFQLVPQMHSFQPSSLASRAPFSH